MRRFAKTSKRRPRPAPPSSAPTARAPLCHAMRGWAEAIPAPRRELVGPSGEKKTRCFQTSVCAATHRARARRRSPLMPPDAPARGRAGVERRRPRLLLPQTAAGRPRPRAGGRRTPRARRGKPPPRPGQDQGPVGILGSRETHRILEAPRARPRGAHARGVGKWRRVGVGGGAGRRAGACVLRGKCGCGTPLPGPH